MCRKCMNSEFSHRVRELYFIAICTVVAIHCSIETPTIGTWQMVFNKYAAKWAVPFFFFSSGVFFRNSYSNNIEGFKYIAIRKFRRLVIPYLIWCMIGAIFSLPMIYCKLHGKSFCGVVDMVSGVSSQSILFIGCVSKDVRLRRLCIAGCFFIIVLAILSSKMRFYLFSFIGTPSSPFYFAAGVVLSRRILSCNANRTVLAAIGGAALVIFAAFGAMGVMSNSIVRHLSNVLAVLIIYAALCLAQRNVLKPSVNEAIRCSFFIYCFHRFFIKYLNLFFLRIGFVECFDANLYYSIYTMYSIFFCLMIALVLRNNAWRIYSLLTGEEKR